jgi:ankyrin repeat protein
LWEFLNAVDFFGNTALHMAVLHRKKNVIDWLMTNDYAKASLEILNFDGFTPLTYAARLGYVDIFNHILLKHLSRTGWTYGKVNTCTLST